MIIAASCLALGACQTTETAEPLYDGDGVTDSTVLKLERELYKDYQRREPCQNYLPAPPKSGHLNKCDDMKMKKVKRMAKLYPRFKSYTVNFDFDKANIRADAARTLDRVAAEIATHKPKQVTVTGYTDTSGPRDYNMILSKRRADAVTDALMKHGIKTRRLDEKARGEEKLAVKTGDGVKLEANRRVVIDFRK